jgi:hypothetical protein
LETVSMRNQVLAHLSPGFAPVPAKNPSFLDAAIAVLERAAPPASQRLRALKFLRGTLQGRPPQADAAGDRPVPSASEGAKTPRPAKR